MTRKPKIRIRNKYSLFCEKRKNPQLIDACVFVQEHNVWAVVKGVSYTSKFRYMYNGREGIAAPYHCIPMREGISKKILKDEAIRLNLQQIQLERPKKEKPRQYRRIDAAPLELTGWMAGFPPIVEQETEGLI